MLRTKLSDGVRSQRRCQNNNELDFGRSFHDRVENRIQRPLVFSRVAPPSIQENISLVRRAVSGRGMFTIGYWSFQWYGRQASMIARLLVKSPCALRSAGLTGDRAVSTRRCG